MNYSVRKTANGEIQLYVNGNSSRCPFTPPLAIPNPLAQRMDISILPCSTACPLACYYETNDKSFYGTKCSGSEIVYKIELDLDKKDNDESGSSILRSLN